MRTDRPATLGRPLSTASFHILIALADADAHGYAIMQAVRDRTEALVRLWPAALYGAIKRLVADGLVADLGAGHPGEDPRRHYYRITAAGRRALAAEASRLETLARQARSAAARPRRA